MLIEYILYDGQIRLFANPYGAIKQGGAGGKIPRASIRREHAPTGKMCQGIQGS